MLVSSSMWTSLYSLLGTNNFNRVVTFGILEVIYLNATIQYADLLCCETVLKGTTENE